MPVELLFLKLESHLRAMKSLDLEKADPALWLFPMVESSLPEEVLLAWQRSPLSTTNGAILNPKKNRLDFLMEFMSQEVHYRQRIALAKGAFQQQDYYKGFVGKLGERDVSATTVAGFVATSSEALACVFCEKQHKSQDCFKAHKMTLEQKKKVLQEKNKCFICFGGGHISKRCKFSMQCIICGKNHHPTMCPDLKQYRHQEDVEVLESNSSEIQVVAGCSNSDVRDGLTCSGKVPLQTLKVVVRGPAGERIVRAVYDGGSQRTYLVDKVAYQLGLAVKKKESIVLSLFGGGHTAPTHVNIYDVDVGRIGGGFKCNLEVRGRDKICHPTPQLSGQSKDLLRKLKQHRVYINDFGNGSPEVELLIGNDYFGSLLTGKVENLDDNLTAIDTKLGWVLSGSFIEDVRSNSVASVSMMVNEMAVCDSNTIGKRNPVKMKTDLEKAETVQLQLLKGNYRKPDVPDHWSHVPGEDNILDLTPRRFSTENVTSKWWEEPKARFSKDCHSQLIIRPGRKSTRMLTVGELVLVGYDNMKRENWPLGRILEFKPGYYGECLVARVKLKTGEITRPVQQLFELDSQFE